MICWIQWIDFLKGIPYIKEKKLKANPYFGWQYIVSNSREVVINIFVSFLLCKNRIKNSTRKCIGHDCQNHLLSWLREKYWYRLRQRLLICVWNLVLWNKMDNECFRNQHSIADPLSALKIGRQTGHKSIWHTSETEDFFSRGIGLFPYPSV